MTTKPEVFIIESLNFADEQAKRFEGQIISQILALSDKRCEYYYVRTEKEFRRVLRFFTRSQYRYLHLSSHGNRGSMFTTLDELPFATLAQILKPHIRNRRLFVSACSMANSRLARAVFPICGCTSILGPDQNIRFSDAAILWSSLYHVMFAADHTAMKRSVLRLKAQQLADIYRVPLNYFGRNASVPFGFDHIGIAPSDEPNV